MIRRHVTRLLVVSAYRVQKAAPGREIRLPSRQYSEKPPQKPASAANLSRWTSFKSWRRWRPASERNELLQSLLFLLLAARNILVAGQVGVRTGTSSGIAAGGSRCLL